MIIAAVIVVTLFLLVCRHLYHFLYVTFLFNNFVKFEPYLRRWGLQISLHCTLFVIFILSFHFVDFFFLIVQNKSINYELY